MGMVALTQDGRPALQALLKQELLLALQGYAGALFEVQTSSGPQARTNLAEELSWLAPSDRKSVQELTSLGSYYKSLSDFCTTQANPLQADAVRQALCEGLTEVLHLYREAILEVQQREKQSKELHVAAVHIYLQRFKTLLPALAAIVQKTSKDQLNGNAVLRELFDMASKCTGEVVACIVRLQWHCLQPLRRRLLAWMVHGELSDNTAEFFVRYAESSSQKASQSTPATTLNFDQIMQGEAGTLQSFQALGDLPPGMNRETANGILFVGRVAWLKRKSASSRQASAAASHAASAPVVAWEVHRAISDVFQADEYDPYQLARLVHAARVQAARQLWDMLIETADLHAHLAAVKAYFLLGRGDHLLAFLVQAQATLEQLPTNTSSANFLEHWQQAAASSSAASDPLVDRFQPVLQHSEVTGQEAGNNQVRDVRPLHPPAYDAWDHLSLHYQADEPLNQIISSTVVVKYNRVWQLLLRLKRADLGLREAWRGLKQRAPKVQLPPAQAHLWRQHQRLAHIIACLLSYLQTDVVEAEWSRFQQRMAAVDSLGAAQQAHSLFLDTLTAHAFLDEPAIMSAVAEVLAQCRQLAATVQFWGIDGPPHQGAGSQAAAVKGALGSLLEALNQLQGVSRSRAPSLGNLVCNLELCDTCQSL